MSQVADSLERSRYELVEQGLVAYADYRRQDDRLLVTYVYAPPELRGGGTAGRLMEGVLADARDKGLKVVPICGYAAAYIRRHRRHHDLLA
jgi:predicted GNAT family acetyltransferase